MKQGQRQPRLVSTYWIQDPVLWNKTYAQQIAALPASGLKVLRMKVKAHPRRNDKFSYRVSITAKVSDAGAAQKYMAQCLALAPKAGIDPCSIVNQSYP